MQLDHPLPQSPTVEMGTVPGLGHIYEHPLTLETMERIVDAGRSMYDTNHAALAVAPDIRAQLRELVPTQPVPATINPYSDLQISGVPVIVDSSLSPGHIRWLSRDEVVERYDYSRTYTSDESYWAELHLPDGRIVQRLVQGPVADVIVAHDSPVEDWSIQLTELSVSHIPQHRLWRQSWHKYHGTEKMLVYGPQMDVSGPDAAVAIWYNNPPLTTLVTL